MGGGQLPGGAATVATGDAGAAGERGGLGRSYISVDFGIEDAKKNDDNVRGSRLPNPCAPRLTPAPRPLPGLAPRAPPRQGPPRPGACSALPPAPPSRPPTTLRPPPRPPPPPAGPPRLPLAPPWRRSRPPSTPLLWSRAAAQNSSRSCHAGGGGARVSRGAAGQSRGRWRAAAGRRRGAMGRLYAVE